MTELDRRAFVTGLAAVAIVPALPAVPVLADDAPLFVRAPRSFQWKPRRTRKQTSSALRVAAASRWHVDIRGRDDATYLHCQTEILFAAYPESPGVIWLMRPAHEPIFPIPRGLFLFGHAAVMARDTVVTIARGRRGRGGCFIVDFKDAAYKQLVTQDAPPLPRVGRFADDIA
jgi:hypothetical protein